MDTHTPIDTREEKLDNSPVGTRAKYRGKTQRRPVGTNHCKFLSSYPRVPDDGRDRALDGGRQEVQPLRPSGRDYDPGRLSPRLAGVRVVRSAMVQVELATGRLHVRRAKNGSPSVHPMQGDEIRALQHLQRRRHALSVLQPTASNSVCLYVSARHDCALQMDARESLVEMS